jgi:uncharacterized membrane protein YidH (DUF202 family)
MIAILLVVLFYPVGVVLLFVAAHMYQETDSAMARTVQRWAIGLAILPVVAFVVLLLVLGWQWS